MKVLIKKEIDEEFEFTVGFYKKDEYTFGYFDGENILSISLWKNINSYQIMLDKPSNALLNSFARGEKISQLEFMAFYDKVISKIESNLPPLIEGLAFQPLIPDAKPETLKQGDIGIPYFGFYYPTPNPKESDEQGYKFVS